jgi:peptidoglycan hydrolase-like protein with peptidoglycan-binding domain
MLIIGKAVMPKTLHKPQNPYLELTEIITKGATGDGVKWVQRELSDSGIEVEIDGDCGPITYQAIKTY